MRQLPFRTGAFQAVTQWFTAFGYFEDDDENYGVLHEVARVLRPGGWYLLDFLNAETVLTSFGSSPDAASFSVDREDGTTVAVRKHLTPPPRVRIEKEELHRAPDGRVLQTIRESVRVFRPEELRAALASAGMPVRMEWGSYDGKPFDASQSHRWIAVCQKA